MKVNLAFILVFQCILEEAAARFGGVSSGSNLCLWTFYDFICPF